MSYQDFSSNWAYKTLITYQDLNQLGENDAVHTHDGTNGAYLDGVLTTSATAVIVNEDSGDVDFRVESNTGTHAIFVDAGTPEVVINDDSIDMDFRVEGNSYDKLLFCDAGTDTVHIGSSDNFGVFSIDKSPLGFCINNVSLTDDQTVALETLVPTGASSNTHGILWVFDSSAASVVASVYIKGGTNTVSEIFDPLTKCAQTDSDTYLCIYADGDGTYTMKNRLGATTVFILMFMGSSDN